MHLPPLWGVRHGLGGRLPPQAGAHGAEGRKGREKTDSLRTDAGRSRSSHCIHRACPGHSRAVGLVRVLGHHWLLLLLVVLSRDRNVVCVWGGGWWKEEEEGATTITAAAAVETAVRGQGERRPGAGAGAGQLGTWPCVRRPGKCSS